MKTPTAALSIASPTRAAVASPKAWPRPTWRAWVGAAGVAGALGWIVAAGARPHAPRLDLIAAAPPLIQLHIAAAVIALAVGTALMVGPKGRAMHKALGWTWVVAMTGVTVSSLFITEITPGRYSLIHLLTGWVVIAVPMGVAAIRRGDVRMHRRMMTGLFVGGLVIAGAFTFAPGRLMWRVFVG